MKSTERDKYLYNNNLSLYAHIPFCVVKCGYCDFNSFAGTDGGLQASVIEGMLRELELRSDDLRPRTIFLGGGTPTHISPTLLEQFLRGIQERVDLSGVVEYSSEANPESANEEQLGILLEHGVRRLSLGVQSFDEKHLRFLDRAHDVEDAIRAFELARRVGFDAVSLDMIFGIPGQSTEEWLDELRQAIALEPDHLSCYHLTFEPGTQLHVDLSKGRVQEIAEEEGRRMLMETRSCLQEAGYPAYEISNFSRPGQECQHNLHYWNAGSYLGIGPGASSHRDGIRQANLRPLHSYLQALEEQGCPIASAETLDPAHRCREALWLGLRLARGVDLARVTHLTSVDPRELFADLLGQMIAEGQILEENGWIRIPEDRLPLADRITACFL